MNPKSYCENHATLARRSFGLAQWIIPSALLVVLPKCPACLAAYVLVWTGVGLSLAAAGVFRTLILIFCVTALVYLAARRLRLLLGARSEGNKGEKPMKAIDAIQAAMQVSDQRILMP